MKFTAERFAQGLTYEDYKARMTRNRERFEENERAASIDTETLRAFRTLPATLRVVVLAEDWCGDVVANLPILGRLAKESGTLDLRVFYRDQNDDLIQSWLNRGKFKSIPVFVFFDQRFKELGHWIERPDSVTSLRAEKTRAIYVAHPEFGSPDAPVDQLPEEVRANLQAEIQKMRADMRPWAVSEVLRELRELVTEVAA